MCSVKFSCNPNIIPFLYALELSAAAWSVLQLDKNSRIAKYGKYTRFDA